MKNKFIIVLLLFVSFSYLSISHPDTANNNRQLTNGLKLKVDTLAVNPISKENNYTDNVVNKSMPWIASLIIGMMTVIVSVKVSKASSKNVDKQIEASTRIAIEQINSSKELALTEFKATLNSKNRQDWINEVRNCLSEYITQCRMLNIECQNTPISSEKFEDYFSKTNYNYYRLLLLLKHNKDEHSPLFTLLNEMSGLMDKHILNARHEINDYDNVAILQKQNEIVKAGMELFYFEWNKIQKMENK